MRRLAEAGAGIAVVLAATTVLAGLVLAGLRRHQKRCPACRAHAAPKTAPAPAAERSPAGAGEPGSITERRGTAA